MTPFALGAIAASLTMVAAPFVTPVDRPISGRSVAVSPADRAMWPLPAPTVLTPFDDPLPYAPGHRGLDLAAHVGQTVTSALPGRVTVAGMVAGRPVVVVEHGDGIRTTYLPVQPSVAVGQHVRAGDPIGSVVASGHCEVTMCVHWGARIENEYIDPASLLPLVTGPIVLLPEP